MSGEKTQGCPQIHGRKAGCRRAQRWRGRALATLHQRGNRKAKIPACFCAGIPVPLPGPDRLDGDDIPRGRNSASCGRTLRSLSSADQHRHGQPRAYSPYRPGSISVTQGCIELDGERFDIRAKLTSIGGYSAHADQQGLGEFVTGMENWPTDIRIVHGEREAKRILAAQLREQYKQHNRPPAAITTGGAEDLAGQDVFHA
ncbi:hypothetical protein IN820_00530 [Pseudomonas sp. AL-54]|nr:hypothetical protein [Pseudomonas lopnurensis]